MDTFMREGNLDKDESKGFQATRVSISKLTVWSDLQSICRKTRWYLLEDPTRQNSRRKGNGNRVSLDGTGTSFFVATSRIVKALRF